MDNLQGQNLFCQESDYDSKQILAKVIAKNLGYILDPKIYNYPRV